ncbi:hypothetical protein [Candidatus Magnetominusculus xianensis]|uniref:Phage-Barnase-EndoU-ColicinE5/D-RelE like nuclease 3 domain-containing protein n=1 Tax=Candidatus Magnetominusculus xianensis TaxID=1748249 RepID=A0ABR5SJU1_9BACT|nr:hypothetical protein [Candidatus Magnetominusculus xianensis]KWT95106.1 hypothetical protein ASN18_0034 [Candidatus Magnetominusculus xianensis]
MLRTTPTVIDYPEHVNLITGNNKNNKPTVMTYQEGFETVYNKTLDNPDNKLYKITYPLSEHQINRIKEQTGLNVAEYSRAIDNYSIRHILRRHGDAKKEEAKGQIGITKDDISRIPEIVNAADKISLVDKTDVGRDGILYRKKINGFIYYVEEVREKHKEINTVSMWKVKSTASDAPPLQESCSATSETLRFPSPSTNDILSNPGETVKMATLAGQTDYILNSKNKEDI